MVDTARPFIVVYIVWHPKFALGRDIAKALFDHFRRESYEKITGGTGMGVVYRYAVAEDTAKPLPIDFSAAETSAVITLVDKEYVSDPVWLEFLHTLASQTDAGGLSTRLFPVVLEQGVIGDLQVGEQAIRWYDWEGTLPDLIGKLIGHLTFQFCRMLRHYLAYLQKPGKSEKALLRYLKKVDIFLSHSKHDGNKAGERVSEAIRAKLTRSDGLGSFFDVYDIPPGLRFQNVLLSQVKVSAVIAVHTDSFSSREWCRREIVEAKRHNRPLVIANCLADKDERGFPYLGNVPIIRLDDENSGRVDIVIRALLDEILRDFLWQCRVELMRPKKKKARITFLPRPPELISLATLVPQAGGKKWVVVYPDPPLGAEEERLFHKIAPKIQLRSATEWLAGAVR
ncbi:toll/interleukin-1 receptor domain-containing protein [Rhizobium sp. 3T7]|uniref:toll/interleukin-1 receptor domain-containing protein n=1 Tax=Rhizobium sp. 3T7 TaxID=2874922 RepID=UPI001CCEA96F|nr:toll/interleukin-1 receptor domain-containing protein [Rhizobium sp. 3T7]MBZ9790492.1 toll/interleukin-1 receptor domain-containing protein [Rhizobium sp. 3T7]